MAEENAVMDAKTTLELFKEIGSLQATNQNILNELQTLRTELRSQEQKYMPREEILSRLREVRASTVLSVIAFLATGIEAIYYFGRAH